MSDSSENNYGIHRLTSSLNETIDNCVEKGQDSDSLIIIDVYVEGVDDVAFYDSWAEEFKSNAGLSQLSVVVKTIKSSEEDSDLIKPEKVAGNCGWVRSQAKLNEQNLRKIWISDRDLMTDDEVEHDPQSNLFFTDFPAIESYGFSSNVLLSLNESMYKNKLNSLGVAYDFLKHYLRGVYFYRCNLRLEESPPKAKDWINKVLKKLEDYRKINTGIVSIGEFVEFADESIPAEIAEKMTSMDSDGLDPRTYAYGHDIAPALKNFIINEERFTRGIKARKIKDIECCIREIYISKNLYLHDNLFARLGDRIQHAYKELSIG